MYIIVPIALQGNSEGTQQMSMISNQKKQPIIRVGVQGTGYVQDRLLGSVSSGNVSLVRVYDVLSVALRVQRAVIRDIPATATLNCLHSGISAPPVQLYHLVNSLSFSPAPWVVSFEHFLPRWDATSRFGIGLMTRTQCRRLHAISEFAREIQMKVDVQSSEFSDVLDRKITVLHPPQIPLVPEYAAKPLPRDGMVFTFVGRDFFRKGGAEVLRAASRLLREGHTFTLNIVSSLDIADYATKSTEMDRRDAVALMKNHHAAIVHHGEMKNADVLQLLRRSHAALLPTYDDTYGFSVLEAQAAGTPVITTNVCALSEINNDDIGWRLNLTLDNRKEVAHLHDGGLASISASIEKGVYGAMYAALTNRDSLRTKGERALRRIKAEHDPDNYVARMHQMYAEALTGEGTTPPRPQH